MKWLSCVQLFATPWTVSHQAPLSMGFSGQEYWSGLPFLSPGNLPDPGTELGSPTLQAGTLTSEPPGKPCQKKKGLTNILDKLLPKYLWSSGDDGLWGPEMHQAGPSLGKDLLPTSRDKGIFQGMPQLQRAVLPKVMSFPEGQPTSRDWDRVIKSQPHQHNTGQP